ncbi:MAG: VCBS repeat-containing protein, partial [Acidobacteriota bacterium]|nr:VCBS repeat-containing protein [Acidobacteriota bacterium]
EARLLTPSRVTDANWRVVGAGDFNNDGQTDLIFRHGTEGWLAGWLMNGTVMQSGNLLSQQVRDPAWKIAAVGDLNGDALPDLVWQHDASGVITSWLMNGFTYSSSAPFRPHQLDDPKWKIKAIGDVNGDGDADLVWQHETYNWLAATILNGTNIIDSAFLSPAEVNSGWSIVGPK